MEKRSKHSRRQDRNLIALKQPHEGRYVLSKAKELLSLCNTQIKLSGRYSRVGIVCAPGLEGNFVYKPYSVSTIARICKSLIKVLK